MLTHLCEFCYTPIFHHKGVHQKYKSDDGEDKWRVLCRRCYEKNKLTKNQEHIFMLVREVLNEETESDKHD